MFKVLIDIPGFALVSDNGVLKADIVPGKLTGQQVFDAMMEHHALVY